jgi:hypothetical protein
MSGALSRALEGTIRNFQLPIAFLIIPEVLAYQGVKHPAFVYGKAAPGLAVHSIDENASPGFVHWRANPFALAFV